MHLVKLETVFSLEELSLDSSDCGQTTKPDWHYGWLSTIIITKSQEIKEAVWFSLAPSAIAI